MAAERVLTTPELVSEIASQLVHPLSSLVHYARINNVWFGEVMRHLWNQPFASPAISLPHALARLDPSRRNFYARFIATTNLIEVQKSTIRQHNRTLRGVHFPRLRSLNLILEWPRMSVYLPTLQAPALQELHIRLATITKRDKPTTFHLHFPDRHARLEDPENLQHGFLPRPPETQSLKKHRLRRGVAKSLSKQIQKRFGHIKTIAFGPEVRIDLQALKYFLDALPGVVVYSEYR